MVSPPRDIDMTSQMEGSEGGAAVLLGAQGQTKSVVEINGNEFNEESNFRKYSTTTHQQTSSVTHHQSQEVFEMQTHITEVGAIEENSSGNKVLKSAREDIQESTIRSQGMLQ